MDTYSLIPLRKVAAIVSLLEFCLIPENFLGPQVLYSLQHLVEPCIVTDAFSQSHVDSARHELRLKKLVQDCQAQGIILQSFFESHYDRADQTRNNDYLSKNGLLVLCSSELKVWLADTVG